MLIFSGFDLSHYCVECCLHNEGNTWPYYEIKENQWPSEEIQRLFVGAYIDEANKVSEDFSPPLLATADSYQKSCNDQYSNNNDVLE